MPLFPTPGIKQQIELIKARPRFYLMNKTANAKATFKFLNAYLLVRHVKPNLAMSSA